MNKEVNRDINNKFWQRIAYIAGGFAFIICILLIANYIQINKDDPVNTETIDLLVERLNKNPDDQELREQIREMDLLARKVYFTSQWQIRMGGYFLLICLAVMVIAIQIILANKKKEPVISEQKDEAFMESQKRARRWISISGAAVVIITLVLAYLSHQEMESKFEMASFEPDEPMIVGNNIEDNSEDNIENSDQVLQVENQKEIDTITIKEEIISEPDTIIIAEDIKKDIVEEVIVKTANKREKETDNFPNFRGPGSNGIITQKNIPTSWNGVTGENVLWKTAIPLKGFNSPVIWGDKIFITSANEIKREIYCIDKNTGEIVWTFNVENVPGSPAKGPDVPDYTGFAAPTATTDGKYVFAIFANGDIVGVDMNGKIVWAKNLGIPDNHYGHSSSLIMYNDKVIVQYDQKNIKQILALSAATGEILWTTKRKVKVAWSSPVVVSTGTRTEIILVAEPSIASYDPETGKELWSLNCMYGEVGPSVAYADGFVYAMNDYAKLVAIKLGSPPEVIWEDDEYLSDVPSPVATDKYLIIPTSYGMVICYDTKTGEKYWEQEFDNTIYASPIISEGKVYLIDKLGVMHIFKADREYVSLGEPELGEKIVCTPAFSEGRIYLRAYDNLYCIGSN